MNRRHVIASLGVAALLAGPNPAAAAEPLRFGVVNQRSPQLTAQYWNPILGYVSQRSGVAIELRLGKAAPDTTAMAVRGELDFYFTNHLFTAERDRLGWRVFARAAGDGIRAQIVVAEDSPLHAIEQLDGQPVVFPSPDAFVGYWVPMDALLRRNVKVMPMFAGTQEGAIAQLRAGSAAAAGVGANPIAEYARREGLRYRVLWASGAFPELALMAHPRVPAPVVESVRRAFVGMAHDPHGRPILEASAALLQQASPPGFVAADDRDYDSYRRFHRDTRVPARAMPDSAAR